MFGRWGWVGSGSGAVGRTKHWRFAWLTPALLAISCGNGSHSATPASGGSSGSKPPSLFEECTPGLACEAGTQCVNEGVFSLCEHPCQSDADCDGITIKLPVDEVKTVCGTLTTELKICTEPCTQDVYKDSVCVDGHPVACAALDEKSCAVCACSGNQRCEFGVGCQPKRDLDAECLTDDDCLSSNCDSAAHVCRVAVGSPCTATNCERCVASRNGTFCSRSCTYNEQCNGAACEFQQCVPLCAGPVDIKCIGECRVSYHPGGGSPDIYACICDPMECVALP